MTELLKSLGDLIAAHAVAFGTVAAAVFAPLIYALLKKIASAAALKAAAAAPPKPAAPGPPEAPAAGKSLADLWTSFRDALPRPVRREPVTIVFGERDAGKSALIRAQLDPSRQQQFFLASATDDPRIQLYPGGDQLVQEISGELIGIDAPPEPLAELFQRTAAPGWFRRTLLSLTGWWPAAHAWLLGLSDVPPPLIVAVVNSQAKGWTPEELRRLGARLRARIDLVTEACGATPHLRVCLTHLDAIDGFTVFAGVLRDVGEREHLRPASARPADLVRCFEPIGCHLSTAIATLPEATDVAKVVGFLSDTGPKLLRELGPMLEALLARGPRSGSRLSPPLFDGVYLSGVPDSGAPSFLGDPFDLDRLVARKDRGLVESRRSQAARVIGASLAGALLAIYAVQVIRVVAAKRAVAALDDATRRAAGQPGSASSTADLARAEREAADALDTAANPLWPPLQGGFRHALGSAQGDFLERLRGAYLLDAARGGARSRRIRAFGVLYATHDNKLGDLIAQQPAVWAAGLSMPEWVAVDYKDRSAQPWQDPDHKLAPGNLDPLPPPVVADPVGRWRTFLDSLAQLFDPNARLDMSRLEALRGQREELLRSLDSAEDVYATREIVDALRNDAKIDGPAVFGPDPLSPYLATWFHEHSKVLRDILDMIAVPGAEPASADPKGSAPGVNRGLAEELALLEHLYPSSSPGDTPACVWVPPLDPAAPAKVASDPRDAGAPADGGADAGDAGDAGGAKLAPPLPPEYTVTLPDGPPTYRFETRVWSGLVTKDRAGQSVRDFLTGIETNNRCVFFPSTSTGAPCGALDPALYTAEAFNNWVRPGLEVLDACLLTLSLADADRARLTARAKKDASAYIDAYVAAQAARWASVPRIDAGSPAALRGALASVVVMPSDFSNALAISARDANLGELKNAYLSTLAVKLAPYRPLVTVMTPIAGPYPQLGMYTAILAQMLPTLDASPPLPKSGVPLLDRLSPLGRAALDTLTGQPTSSYLAVQKWLDSAGLVDDFRKPFSRPVELAYAMGLREVEDTIATAWRSEIAPGPMTILSRFPFQKLAADTSAAEITASFGPQGTFWTAFEGVVKPAATMGVDKKWQAKQGPLGPIHLPAGALDLTNDLTALKASLWTEDGAPKPIALQVKPVPMAAVSDGEAVTMAVLQVAKSSVFGINQHPDWQPLVVVWGSGQSASVALRITPEGGGEPRFRTLDGGSSDFAFHHLLARSTPAGKGNLPAGTLEWVFTEEKPGEAPQRVRFTFQSDPWAPFQLRSGAR